MENITAAVVNGDEIADKTFPKRGDDLVERSGLSGRVFYDESSKLFYAQNNDGEWVGRDRQTFSTYLKFQGYIPTVRTAEPHKEKISELEHVITHISMNCAVKYAGPVAGYKRGLIENNGRLMLVTNEAEIMKPEPGDWPTLKTLFEQMFGHGSPDAANDGPDQLPYFYGTWKHALECLNDKYTDKRVLCLAMAGEAGCGKTLVKTIIALSLGGRECKPYRYMIGQDNFSGDLLGSEVWGIDDEQGGDTSMKARLKFGGELKMLVAEELFRIRAIGRDGVALKMFKFPIICLNREPERLKVLPPLDDDIADKISVLLAHKHPMPMPCGKPADKEVFWNTLTSELPHFIHYLLNEHEIAAEDYGRFGMKHFHHPDLCSDLFQVGHEREFWVQVMRVLKRSEFCKDDAVDVTGDGWYWCGGAEDLSELMHDEESTPLSRNEINRLPSSNAIGKNLKKIAKEYPKRVVQKKVGGIRYWFITKEGRDVLDAVKIERGRARATARPPQGHDEEIEI